MTIADSFLLILLAAWLSISLANQIALIPSLPLMAHIMRRIQRHDHAFLIPIWSFFAPTPSEHDYCLLYRYELNSCGSTEWIALDLMDERRWWHCVWNPGKYEQKAFFDLVQILSKKVLQLRELQGALELDRRVEELALQTSIPYLAMLNVAVACAPRDATAVQMLVVTVRNNGQELDIQPMLGTEWHEILPAGPAS